MRQVIISIIGLLVLGAGVFGMKKMASTEKPEPPKELRAVPTVFTETVKNGKTPITVTASGNLAARDRIEIYSEVQGIFENSSNQFKPGVSYRKGNVLLSINSEEHRANLRAQKSSLFNQIVVLLPDLRFDYPEAFQKWQDYVDAYQVEEGLNPLPEPSSNKEKLFIAGRNITTTWFNVKNMEERLSKYTLYAPFNGVLTEATVDKGALVRSGQKLGEFINPNVYELEVAVNSSYIDLLKVGNSVRLNNIERTKTWQGKVNRINSLIDPNSQTIQAFISVSGKGLREGMYLEADLTAQEEANTYVVSRKLIVDNDKLFVVEGNKLILKIIQPIHYTEKTAVVKGLSDGTKILNKSLPGAYEGMQIKQIEN